MNGWKFFVAISSLLLPWFSTLLTAEDPITVKYGDRRIDIRRYVGISDYGLRTMANPDDGSLYWVRWGTEGGEILHLPASEKGWDESAAKVVHDFGMRSFWSPAWNAQKASLFFVSDVNNDETFNVYRFDPTNNQISQVTDVAYTVCYAATPSGKNLVYPGRRAKTAEAGFLFESSAEHPEQPKVLFSDSPEIRIYPYEVPVIDQDDRRIAFVVKKDNRRSNLNLAVYSRDTDKVTLITDQDIGRNRLKPLAWMGDDLLFISDEGTDQQSLFRFDAKRQQIRPVFDNPLKTMEAVYDPCTQRIVSEIRDGETGRLLLISPVTGNVVAEQDVSRYELWWSHMCHPLGDGHFAVSAKVRGEREVLITRIDASVGKTDQILTEAWQPSLNQQLASPCQIEEVSYPTFDMNEEGETRSIDAVLFLPDTIPANPDDRAAIVWAHGGPTDEMTTSWNAEVQMLVAMGYIVLGPNPRGSSGRGKSFEDLNNEDWGGGDYRDYEHGLRYLAKRFEIPHQRIGIAGFSFGGYMTNWAVTRPHGPFGFGISQAGMADLELSIAQSVVANNTISELGDPKTNKHLYRERSPIHWSRFMDVPLLLIHGERDNRTVTTQSRNFYEKLCGLDKDVSYVEVKGEGHGFRALKSQQTSFQAQADFLRRVVPIKSKSR